MSRKALMLRSHFFWLIPIWLGSTIGAAPVFAQARVSPALDRPAHSDTSSSQLGREATRSYSAAGHGIAAFIAGATIAVSVPIAVAGDHWEGTDFLVVSAASALLVGTVVHAWRGSATPPESAINRAGLQDQAALGAFATGYRAEVLRKRRRALLWAPLGAVMGGAGLIALIVVSLSGTD